MTTPSELARRVENLEDAHKEWMLEVREARKHLRKALALRLGMGDAVNARRNQKNLGLLAARVDRIRGSG